MNLIIRILGNDLSGLHGSDQTITNLKFTLEHEPNFPNTKKLFLLNRIYNTEKRQNIIKLLEKHSVDYIELPFQLSEFNKLKYGKNNNKFLKYYEYNLYLVNNNGSRNYCIDYGKKNGYNWTFALDSNAFFTQNMWDNIFDNLKPETEYISLPQKRLSEKNLSNETILNNLDLDLLPEQEPQIAFHKNSKLKYNDKIPYGSSPKAEMLRVLKVPGKWNKWRDNFTIYNIPDRKYHDVNFQNLSSVIRLNSQNKNRKDSVKNNYHARINGVENLVNKIKNENDNKNKLDIIEGFSDNNNLKNNLILLLFLVLIVLSSLKKNKIYSIIILILIFIKLTTINKSEHFTNQNIKSISPVPRPNNWNKMPFLQKLRHYALHLTPEHAKYADKLLVKKLIGDLGIKNLHFAKVIKVFKNNEELILSDLPLNCVIKSNNGWNDMIIIKNGKIEKMITKGKKLKPIISNFNIWKKEAVKPRMKEFQIHYKFIEPQIFAEEYLEDNLNDYKSYCFNGNIAYIKIYKDRFKNKCNFNVDKNFNKTSFNNDNNICSDTKIDNNLKKNLKKMSKISNFIGKIFEFARIDFYLLNDKIYFGEITLTPEACYMIFKPIKYDYEVGKYWN